MIGPMKKFVPNKPLVGKDLDRIVSRLSALGNIRGTGGIRISRNPMGMTIGGGGSATAGDNTIWGVVLRSLQYADPDGSPPGGYSSYIMTLKTDNVEVWSSATTYTVGQKCYVDIHVPVNQETPDLITPTVFAALGANTNEKPPNAKWEESEIISPRGLCLEGSGYGVAATDLRYTDRWYHVGDEVPMLKINNVYYFEDVVVPVVNTSGEGSLRWNEDEQRLMAVYR